jgi:hypothetical protein
MGMGDVVGGGPPVEQPAHRLDPRLHAHH